MRDDIVDRLRANTNFEYRPPFAPLIKPDALSHEAADEIERLRAALMPFASRDISDRAPNSDTVPVTVGDMRRARKAFNGGR
jgi:hypothetical protein